MLGTVVDNGLFEYALIKPLFRSDAPESIKIVSGYATHAMAARHLIESTSRKKKLSVDLIYGMAGSDGVSKINHLGFISLEQHKEFAYNGDFTCSYVESRHPYIPRCMFGAKATSPFRHSSVQPTIQNRASIFQVGQRRLQNVILQLHMISLNPLKRKLYHAIKQIEIRISPPNCILSRQ